MQEKPPFSPDDRKAWILIGLLAAGDMLGLAMKGITLAWDQIALEAAIILFLLCIGRIYTAIRPDRRLAALAMTGAQLAAYTTVAGIFSYVLTAQRQMAIDPWLVAADHALGFDWLAVYAWGKAHLFAHMVAIVVYFSLIPQLLLMQLFLITRRHFDRARELFWLFVTTSLSCVIIGGLLPAEGAFVTFQKMLDEPYVQQLIALRGGSLTYIGLQQMQGVVQFPSFHLAMAVILTYAARGIPVLFPLLLIINGAVIAATPLVGGHHLADLWGGAVVTMLCIFALRHVQRKQKS